MTNNRPNLRNINRNPGKPEGTAAEPQFYAYFVSVLDMGPRGLCTSQVELLRSKRITTMQDVTDVQNWVRAHNTGFETATVLGFTLLRMVPASEVPGQR